jgi:hypothetical protein
MDLVKNADDIQCPRSLGEECIAADVEEVELGHIEVVGSR